MNSSPPLVSIIMPTYNSSAFILKTLQELESQDFDNYEVVVVNDGSKDNTLDILTAEAKKNPRLVLVDKENGGVSSARNAGIRVAKGEFISFLDDDDRITPNFIIKMYTQQRKTGVDAVYCGMYRVYDDTEKGKVKVDSEFIEGHILYSFLTGKVNFHLGSLFIRRKIIEENNLSFNERLKIGEDILYIYQLLSLCSVSSVAEYMYYYICRPGSVMNVRRDSQHYQHEAYAHEVIRDTIAEKYNLEDRDRVLDFLCTNTNYHKIRYMWKLLQLGNFSLLSSELKSNSDFFADRDNFSSLDKKTKRRAMYIKTDNKIIWRIIRMIKSG